MKKYLVVFCAIALVFGAVSIAEATLVTYTSEADYLSALSLYGYDTFFEGFESSAWDASRPDGTASVTNQGLTWTASDLVRTNNNWARSGSYGVFDSWGDPDQLYTAASSQTLYGIGGWFKGYSTTLQFTIDGTAVVGPSILSTHVFFGIIETSGFTQVTMSPSFHMGADDFTFATAPIPEPGTIFLLGAGLAGLAVLGRKKFLKK